MSATDQPTIEYAARNPGSLHKGSARSVIRAAKEWIIESLLFLCAFISVILTTGIVVLLTWETIGFFYNHGQIAVVVPDDKTQDLDQAVKPFSIKDTRRSETTTLVLTQRGDYNTIKDHLARNGFKIDPAQSKIVGAPLGEFLTGTSWHPAIDPPKYGIWPLLSGTLTITAVALLVALPLGTVGAIYLSEYASHKLRETVKPVLELLSAVPTVVYGYFALQFVTPLLQGKILSWFAPMPNLTSFNMLSAGLVMGIMIIPYVSSLSEDAMRAVPMSLREGSYAMGATKMQTAFRVVMPASFSGITAAYILGISRALGETMIVAIAAGQQPVFTFNPTEQAATITAYITQVAGGDLPHGSIPYQSIFAAGLVLFMMTFMFNIIGSYLRKKYRQAY